MCPTILSFVTRIYPFAKEISKKQYTMYAIIQTVILFFVWHENIRIGVWYFFITYTLSLPLTINHYRKVYSSKYIDSYLCYSNIFIYIVLLTILPPLAEVF